MKDLNKRFNAIIAKIRGIPRNQLCPFCLSSDITYINQYRQFIGIFPKEIFKSEDIIITLLIQCNNCESFFSKKAE